LVTNIRKPLLVRQIAKNEAMENESSRRLAEWEGPKQKKICRVLPEVEELERLHVDDGLRDGADGVVVQEESLEQEVVGALLRKLC